MIEAGTVLQNRYLIEKQIGAGGMGTVYLATDQRFDSPVAIKEALFKDEDLQRAFEREAQLLNRLRHPALPRVIDYFAEADAQFLVMEYITGADLSAILKQTQIFPVRDVLRWADELLSALEYLHTQTPPVIHRDIKPQNLKLTTTGEIILLDFGLAKGKTGETSQLSITNSVFGYSRSYAPLEQIQGTGTDLRSDVYSLAATLYHLFSGKPPVDALTRATSYVNQQPDPLLPVNELNSEIPDSVAAVLAKALELNAGLRWDSATAMRTALHNADQRFSAASATAKSEPADDSDDDQDATQISRNNADFAAATAALAVDSQNSTAAAAAPVISEKVEPSLISLDNSAAPSIKINSGNSTAGRRRFGARRKAEEAVESATANRSKTPLVVAAAILVLGGGLALWAANRQSSSNRTDAGAQTVGNGNRVESGLNPKPLETTINAANTSAATSAALNSNSGIQTIAPNAANISASAAKRSETIVKPVSSNNASSATKPDAAAEETPTETTDSAREEQPRTEPQEKPATPARTPILITAPSPIIVKSAPPSNQPRRNSDENSTDQKGDNDDAPPASPRTKKGDDAQRDNDNPPQANARKKRDENQQKLPTILGAPPDNR